MHSVNGDEKEYIYAQFLSKLHMLIVSLGRKGRERLNKIKFHFVHSRKIHRFVLSAHAQSETFEVSAWVFLPKAGWAASPSHGSSCSSLFPPWRKVNRTGYSTGPWHSAQPPLRGSPTLVCILFNLLFFQLR